MVKLSLETTNRLHEQLRQQIVYYEKSVDYCAVILKFVEGKQETSFIVALKGVLKTQLMLYYINLDLCAAYRQYLSTDTSTNYENRQAMTKINVTMSEGYKKIYGFNESQQNKSFWVSQIKIAVDYLGYCTDEYNRVEELLKVMKNDNVIDKEMRNLAIHYDDDPLKVYKMLSNLSAEEITSRCNKFFGVLAELIKFVSVLINNMTSTVVNDEQFTYISR